VVFVLLATVAVRAQTIPSEVVRSPSGLGDAARQQIQAYVERVIGDLSAQDPVRIRDARNHLLLPLSDREVGVPFRLEYSRQLCPRLEGLAQDSRPIVAVNALRIAGDLATDRSVEILLSHLEHKEASIRLASAAGLARVFEAMRDTAPAMDAQSALRLLNRAADRLAAEPEPHVADALARALLAAGSVEKDGFASLRPEALRLSATRVADRIKAKGGAIPSSAEIDTILRTLSTLSVALAEDNTRPVARRFSEGAVKAAARLADESLGLLIDLARGGRLPVADPSLPREEQERALSERAWAVAVAAAADNVAYFALQRLGERASQSNPPLSSLLSSGRRDADARFITDASSLRQALSRF
jgi:hypothetical protein